MNLSIPFTELNTLIQQKTQQPVTLSFVSNDTINVTYPLKLFLKTVDIAAKVQVMDINGAHIRARVDMGSAGNLALQGGFGLLGSMLPEGLVESFADGIAEINLAKIPKLEKTLEMVEVKGVVAAPEVLNLEVGMK